MNRPEQSVWLDWLRTKTRVYFINETERGNHLGSIKSLQSFNHHLFSFIRTCLRGLSILIMNETHLKLKACLAARTKVFRCSATERDVKKVLDIAHLMRAQNCIDHVFVVDWMVFYFPVLSSYMYTVPKRCIVLYYCKLFCFVQSKNLNNKWNWMTTSNE